MGIKDNTTVFKFGRCIFFPKKRILNIGEHTSMLTCKESELLIMLCNFANRLLPRELALISIWSQNTYFNARSMDVYISRLRKYLKEDTDISIMNVHGKGFKMLVPHIETDSTDNSIKDLEPSFY